MSVLVETFGTGRIPEEQIAEAVTRDLRSSAGGDHPPPEAAAPDLQADGGVRTLRPSGSRSAVGARRPRRRAAQSRPLLMENSYVYRTLPAKARRRSSGGIRPCSRCAGDARSCRRRRSRRERKSRACSTSTSTPRNSPTASQFRLRVVDTSHPALDGSEIHRLHYRRAAAVGLEPCSSRLLSDLDPSSQRQQEKHQRVRRQPSRRADQSGGAAGVASAAVADGRRSVRHGDAGADRVADASRDSGPVDRQRESIRRLLVDTSTLRARTNRSSSTPGTSVTVELAATLTIP